MSSRIKTPLRYPGGKQRLWPFIYEILCENNLIGAHYAEPYAGGAGVAFELLFRNHVSKIHLNDSSSGIYAFWRSVLNEPERFCRKISRASMTVDFWKKQREILRSNSGADRFELGFATFFLNRCNRSGILDAGVIGGLDQSGEWKMDARFPRNELITRIELIASRKSDITFLNWDAEKFMTSHLGRIKYPVFTYCDPPYFKKADRLYLNHYSTDDHQRVSDTITKKLKTPWVTSYDSCKEISDLYAGSRMMEYSLQYNAGKAYKGKELFIFDPTLQIPRHSILESIDTALGAV